MQRGVLVFFCGELLNYLLCAGL